MEQHPSYSHLDEPFHDCDQKYDSCWYWARKHQWNATDEGPKAAWQQQLGELSRLDEQQNREDGSEQEHGCADGSSAAGWQGPKESRQ